MTPSNIIMRPIEIGRRVIGIWPRVSHHGYFFIILSISLFSFVFQRWDVIFSDLHITKLIDNLAALTVEILFYMKFITLWIRRRALKDILTEILKDWEDTEGMKVKEIIAEKHRMSKTFYVFLYSLYLPTNLFFVIYTVIINDNANTEDRRFLLPSKYPFEAYKSPNFEILCFFQFSTMVVCTVGNGIFESTFMMLVLHAGAKIDMINEEIINFSKISRENNDKKLMLQTTKNVMNKYKNLVNYCQKIEEIYSDQLLITVMGNILAVCFSGYMIIILTKHNPNSYNTIKFTLFAASDLFQIGAYCFGGEYLRAKSESIRLVAYFCSWYKMHPSDCKTVLFILISTQKPITITAGKLMHMTLSTYTDILKASMSFFSVLRAIHL